MQKRIPDKKHATLASSSSSWIPVLKNDGSVGVIHESSAVDLESIGDSLKLVLNKYQWVSECLFRCSTALNLKNFVDLDKADSREGLWSFDGSICD